MLRVAIDIGGTFTDLVLADERGEIHTEKVLTTPEDPSAGFGQILDAALETVAEPPGRIGHLVHGTTIATNALLEEKTARLGLITTAGFRDVLEIGRHFRRDLYNFFLEKPPPLVPRERRIEVSERVDAAGHVLVSLDEDGVRRAVERMSQDGVEAIVICFLHSYANPAHELRAGRIVEQYSGLPCILSHGVCSEFREYERFSTAAINASILPVVGRYLKKIDDLLVHREVRAPLSVMQSNGGMLPATAVRGAPGAIVESGPAAGAIAAAEVGRRLEIENLICLDMGGTTAKATLIRNGQISLNNDYEVGAGIQGGFGTGYPLRLPVVDLVEVGTGGGSIAYLDDAGQLHVGPRSAGAAPGPACYGRGGTEPTVTDANLLLGRLRSDHFAAGRLVLAPEAARQSVHSQIAEPLGLPLPEAAEGIIRIANAQMGHALKIVSTERGYDPRDHALVAFGGAGPMHAVDLARELGSHQVIIPPEAGVQSAWGMLAADARYDFARSFLCRADNVNLEQARRIFREMADEGQRLLVSSGFGVELIQEHLSVDVRYLGQAYELAVEAGESVRFDKDLIEHVGSAFHRLHQRLYTYSDVRAPLEWVTLRATVVGPVDRPAPRRLARASSPLSQRRLCRQPVIWAGREHQAAVFERNSLAFGDALREPTLILQDDATVCLPPDAELAVAATGDLLIDLR